MVIGCVREIKDNEYRVGLVPGVVQALHVFSEWQSICIDYSGTLQRAQIDA
jgi:alanine dehydrogenase